MLFIVPAMNCSWQSLSNILEWGGWGDVMLGCVVDEPRDHVIIGTVLSYSVTLPSMSYVIQGWSFILTSGAVLCSEKCAIFRGWDENLAKNFLPSPGENKWPVTYQIEFD